MRVWKYINLNDVEQNSKYYWIECICHIFWKYLDLKLGICKAKYRYCVIQLSFINNNLDILNFIVFFYILAYIFVPILNDAYKIRNELVHALQWNGWLVSCIKANDFLLELAKSIKHPPFVVQFNQEKQNLVTIHLIKWPWK